MHNGSRPVAVVDDDDAVRDSLQFLLETEGLHVATFASATEFLERGQPGGLKCLVVDQHMPGVTGLQLVAELRSRGATTPIVLITGSPSADLLRQAHDLGVSKVLEKPLDDDTLLEFIAKAG